MLHHKQGQTLLHTMPSCPVGFLRWLFPAQAVKAMTSSQQSKTEGRMSARMEERERDCEGDTGETVEDSALDKPFAPLLLFLW